MPVNVNTLSVLNIEYRFVFFISFILDNQKVFSIGPRSCNANSTKTKIKNQIHVQCTLYNVPICLFCSEHCHGCSVVHPLTLRISRKTAKTLQSEQSSTKPAFLQNSQVYVPSLHIVETIRLISKLNVVTHW